MVYTSLAFAAFISLAVAGGSCQGTPTAVLDVPFTFSINGVNQTFNGDNMVCADIGNSTSGLGIYVQMLDNAAPDQSTGAVNAQFSPLLLAVPGNETRPRGHLFSNLRAGRTEFISAGCSNALPRYWMFLLVDLNAELADVFRKPFNLPAFDLKLTIVLKQLPALFC
jgi:hypothetical protein